MNESGRKMCSFHSFLLFEFNLQRTVLIETVLQRKRKEEEEKKWKRKREHFTKSVASIFLYFVW